MKKNSLTPNKGLSLSQAQSISNLCYQRAKEIESALSNVNNYQKTLDIVDLGHNQAKTHVILAPNPLPKNTVSLLKEKASLHACQAFLMENIKAKDVMLKEAKTAVADVSVVKFPKPPEYAEPTVIPFVDENWGWEQLTVGEINEFTEAEAFAAHIGQFIHQGGVLDNLRKELPTIPPIEWMVITEGIKSPVNVLKHVDHTPEKLLEMHETLAKLHREYEQRVNYFKAKVKNLVTNENARIANINADALSIADKTNSDLMIDHQTAYKAAQAMVQKIRADFEKTRQLTIREIAAMRIQIDVRFQDTIDLFLKQLSDTQE
jgi:hypothetical protein